jgi:hypothetical protein
VPPEFLTKETMTMKCGARCYGDRSTYKEDRATPLHVAVSCGHANQIPKEFLTPEFLTLKWRGETVLQMMARLGAADLVPAEYAADEMWNFRESGGGTARESADRVLEWRYHREAYVGRVRAEPATEKQKEKLRYFGCKLEGDITKGEASDALDECVKRFPEANYAYYNRPTTEEQKAKLTEMNEEEEEDGPEEGFTYGQAKASIEEWERSKMDWEEKQFLASDLQGGVGGPQSTCDEWDDDYQESERGFFEEACSQIYEGWDFKFGDLPRRAQVAKIWELVKSRKRNKKEWPTKDEIVSGLIELASAVRRRERGDARRI